MARESGLTKTELADRINEIGVLLEEALDPDLSLDALRAKVKEIQEVANGENGTEVEEEDEEDLD